MLSESKNIYLKIKKEIKNKDCLKKYDFSSRS